MVTDIFLNILIPCLSSSGIFIVYLEHRWKKEEKNNIEHEILKFLAMESLTRYLRDLVEIGEASYAEKQYAEDYHNLYKRVGWNGQLDNLINQVRNLPLHKEEQ